MTSALPGSEGLLSPRWSPDGRYIAATTMDSQKLLLFDTGTKKWNELAHVAVGYLCWSKDSKYLYFDTFGTEPSIDRIGIQIGSWKRWSALRTCVACGVLMVLGLDWHLTTLYSQPGISAVKRCMPIAVAYAVDLQVNLRFAVQFTQSCPRLPHRAPPHRIQIKIIFDLFIVESRSTKGSQPEPGRDQAESLARSDRPRAE